MTNKKKSTDNTYEAAYYLANGGVVDKVTRVYLSKNTREKKGFGFQWVFKMSNVDEDLIRIVKNGGPMMNINRMKKYRNKIKKLAVKEFE